MEMSCLDVQALFSEYLDEELRLDGISRLSEIQLSGIQRHFKDCHLCLEQYMTLRESRHEVSSLQHTTPMPPEMPDLWARLGQQLEQDKACPPVCRFDEDFVSAYFDGEHEEIETGIALFESHLVSCTPCNELLADMGEISEVCKNFAYRLEEALTPHLEPLEFPRRVLAQYQLELGVTVSGGQACREFSVETLSAFRDDELAPKVAIALGNHLEQCALCKNHLQGFQLLSQQIQDMARGLEAEAPDAFWPLIQKELSRESRVAPFSQRVLKGRKQLWTISASAAAAFLFVMISVNHVPWMGGYDASKASVMQQVGQMTAKRESSDAYDGDSNAQSEGKSIIAWLPPTSNRANFAPSADSGASAAPEMAPTAQDAESVSSPKEEMAAKPGSPMRERRMRKEYSSVPSSEEYMFNMNSRDLPSEDLPAVLGASEQ